MQYKVTVSFINKDKANFHEIFKIFAVINQVYGAKICMGGKTYRYYKHTKFRQNPRGDPTFLVDLYGVLFVSKFLWHGMDKNRFDVYKIELMFIKIKPMFIKIELMLAKIDLMFMNIKLVFAKKIESMFTKINAIFVYILHNESTRCEFFRARKVEAIFAHKLFPDNAHFLHGGIVCLWFESHDER